MTKKGNLEHRIKNWFSKTLVSGILALGSLGLVDNTKADYDFVNPAEGSALVHSAASPRPHVMGDPNDMIPFKNWSLIPRTPAISNWGTAYVQNPNPDYDPNSPLEMGDAYVIYQGPITAHGGKKIRITNTRAVGIVDLDENNLVYDMGEGIAYPHWPSEIYFTDLSKINLDNLIDLGDGTFAPTENRSTYEKCITCGLTNPNNPGNMDPQISGDKIVWRTGYYKPYEDPSYNLWKEIWMYSISEEMAFPISNISGNKWWPSIDGDWVVYPVYEGLKLNAQGKFDSHDPNCAWGTWNTYGYNISSAQEFLIDNTGGEKRTARVYDDALESGQAIVAYGKGEGIPCSWGAVCFARLKLEGSTVIINPLENTYNLPQMIPTGGMTEWIDIFGKKGTITNPGNGPIIAFMNYSPTAYGGGTRIDGYNLRTDTPFSIASAGSNWLYSPRGWINNNNQAVIVYRDDNADVPPSGGFSAMTPSLDDPNQPEKVLALIINNLKQRPIPAYCGDEGGWFYDGDFNKDCIVNLEDLLVLANNWLEGDCSYNNNACNDTDINKDQWVDSKDYAVWLENLGKKSFGEPNFVEIIPSTVDPNIIATNEITSYFDYNQAEQSYQEGYLAPLYQKRLITYKFEDKSFGNLNIDKINIPVRNVESTNPYLESPYYNFNFPESRLIGKNWGTVYEPNLAYLTDNENEKLNAGKTAVFNILTSALGYQIKPVKVHTAQGYLEYNMKVPLEQTLKSDTNRDLIVDYNDAMNFFSNWLGKGLGDFDNSGNVDFKDFNILSYEFGKKESQYGQDYINF